MKEMQANSVQHDAIVSTVRIFFCEPVLFLIRKPRFQNRKSVSVYNLNYILDSGFICRGITPQCLHQLAGSWP